jgi:thiamine biosynthesis protein ThiS
MEVLEGTSVTQLLQILEIGSGPLAVEKNLEIVRKEDYDRTLIQESDQIEIVHFVGGG